MYAFGALLAKNDIQVEASIFRSHVASLCKLDFELFCAQVLERLIARMDPLCGLQMSVLFSDCSLKLTGGQRHPFWIGPAHRELCVAETAVHKRTGNELVAARRLVSAMVLHVVCLCRLCRSFGLSCLS